MLKKIYMNNSGFTLIEVLVALVILTIGLLGLAGLQARGLSGSTDALIRSQATLYVYDMAERMRANRDAAISGKYTTTFGAAPTSTGDVVEDDLVDWLAELATLPGGEGAISTASGVTTISVRWSEKGASRTLAVDTQI